MWISQISCPLHTHITQEMVNVKHLIMILLVIDFFFYGESQQQLKGT